METPRSRKSRFVNGSKTFRKPREHFVITPAANTVRWPDGRITTWSYFLSTVGRRLPSRITGRKIEDIPTSCRFDTGPVITSLSTRPSSQSLDERLRKIRKQNFDYRQPVPLWARLSHSICSNNWTVVEKISGSIPWETFRSVIRWLEESGQLPPRSLEKCVRVMASRARKSSGS